MHSVSSSLFHIKQLKQKIGHKLTILTYDTDSYALANCQSLISSHFFIVFHMSRSMTKPTKWLSAQRRLRSAWVFAQSVQSSLCAQWVAKDQSFLHAHSEASDQTGWMPRLIWVFPGRRCHFVGFVMRWLTYVQFWSCIYKHDGQISHAKIKTILIHLLFNSEDTSWFQLLLKRKKKNK